MDDSLSPTAATSSVGQSSARPSLLHLDGEEVFDLVRETLWQRLTDLSFLVTCMPDLERVASAETKRLAFRVRPGFAFLRGTLEIVLELTDSQRPDRADMRITSKGVGSGATLAARFQLTDIADSNQQTQLLWSADVLELQGLLKPVSRSLIGAAARQVIAQVITRLRTELARA